MFNISFSTHRAGRRRQRKERRNVGKKRRESRFPPPVSFIFAAPAKKKSRPGEIPRSAFPVHLSSERRDSNPRPPEPHSGALPGCATLRIALAMSGIGFRFRGRRQRYVLYSVLPFLSLSRSFTSVLRTSRRSSTSEPVFSGSAGGGTASSGRTGLPFSNVSPSSTCRAPLIV